MHHVDGDQEGDSGDLFARGQLRDYLAFVVGSVRRRKRLVAIVLSSIVALSIVALLALPRTYHVEAKLFTQRNQVLAVRGDGPDAVGLTRGAAEAIQRRDNLIALIQTTDLVNHYREHRSVSQRVIDAVTGPLRGPETDQDRIDAMVELLQKRLVVWTNEGTVTIALDWPDAQMACRLVDTAQKSFLDRRHAQEITALEESIAILRGHAAILTANIDAAVEGVTKLRGDRPAGAEPAKPEVRAPAPRMSARVSAEPTSEQVRLKAAMEAKQRVIDDLEQVRRRRLAELQTRLVEQRSTYTDNHPIMLDLQQSIASLSQQSPQVKVLLQEVAGLRAEYDGAARSDPSGEGPAPERGSAAGAAPPPLPSEILRLDQELREDRDPATVFARGQLRDAMDKYAALRAQVQAAQIDLETTQAAFKYRYSVLTPAQLPKRAVKPNFILVLLMALVGGALTSIVAAVIADLRNGRLVERWQIERLLDRPILGEMQLARLPSQDPE